MTLGSSFTTYLWHYVLVRLMYDHLVLVLVAVIVLLFLRARSRR